MHFDPFQNGLQVRTPAKLNLSLRVLGQRPDGFHDLESVMVSVRWYDTLRFERCETHDIDLSCQGLGAAQLPTDDRNLVVRAARLLQQHTGCPRGARIFLHKDIPSEAGLGGGSSDAAATLVALNRLWELRLYSAELHRLAARLGSDVNFFLCNSPAAWCTGRGEITSPLPLRQQLHFVIVKPPSGLSTRDVFQRWAKLEKSPRSSHRDLREVLERRPVLVGCALGNDLQSVARELNPDVDRLLFTLESLHPPGCLLTGSGSACFALSRTAREAQRLASRLRHLNLGEVRAASSGV